MKQKLQNTKSNSHGSIRLGVSLATVFAVFMLTACSDGNGTKSFHSSDEAIREYHGFLSTLRQCDKVAIQSLAKTINEWRVLDDSVTSCISRDTVRKAHSYPFAVYRELNDSIHIELCRMAMSKQRTFHDLLYLREQTPPMPVMRNYCKPRRKSSRSSLPWTACLYIKKVAKRRY